VECGVWVTAVLEEQEWGCRVLCFIATGGNDEHGGERDYCDSAAAEISCQLQQGLCCEHFLVSLG
jgi:hypothetical protein